MILTLPYPPSSNRYWRNVKGRVVVSREAREYKKTVAKLALVQRGSEKAIAGRCMVVAHFYRPARRGDLDNLLKVVLDALRGIAYGDDSQITYIAASRFESPKEPRAEVTIQPSWDSDDD